MIETSKNLGDLVCTPNVLTQSARKIPPGETSTMWSVTNGTSDASNNSSIPKPIKKSISSLGLFNNGETSINAANLNTTDSTVLESVISELLNKHISWKNGNTKKYVLDFYDGQHEYSLDANPKYVPVNPSTRSLSLSSPYTSQKLIDLNDLRTEVNANGKTIAEALANLVEEKARMQNYRVTVQTNSSSNVTSIDFNSEITSEESALNNFTIDYKQWFQKNSTTAVIPDDLDGKGFHAYCQGCEEQWFNFIFQNGLDIPDGPNPEEFTYTKDNRTIEAEIKSIYIDVSGVTDARSLVEAIYQQGEKAANQGSLCCEGIDHNIHLAMDPDAGTLTVYDYRANMTSLYYGGMAIAEGVYSTSERNLNPYEKNLIIQDTEKPDSCIAIHIPDMRLDNIFSQIRPKTIKDYPVTSERAIKLLLGTGRDKFARNPAGTSKCGILDQGIDYVLGAVTKVGAQMQRLELSNSNITTKQEKCSIFRIDNQEFRHGEGNG